MSRNHAPQESCIYSREHILIISQPVCISIYIYIEGKKIPRAVFAANTCCNILEFISRQLCDSSLSLSSALFCRPITDGCTNKQEPKKKSQESLHPERLRRLEFADAVLDTAAIIASPSLFFVSIQRVYHNIYTRSEIFPPVVAFFYVSLRWNASPRDAAIVRPQKFRFYWESQELYYARAFE